jgi:two-component system sensor histidine kinase UhpB
VGVALSASGEALWAFFVAAAVGLTVVVLALAAAVTIAQHRVLGLHRFYGRRLLATQDEERAWVAREVHDDVVQRLAVLRHELDSYKAGAGPLDEPQRRRLAGLEGEIQDLNEALRRLAHRLHPATLDHGDVRLALEQLAHEAGRAHGLYVALDANLDGAGALRSPDLALAVYRIGQEALRNVARHAQVTGARLGAAVVGGDLVLTVSDEGRGFDPGVAGDRNTGRREGLGLLTMQERARIAGGSATVESQPGEGTRVTVRLPLAGPGEEVDG